MYKKKMTTVSFSGTGNIRQNYQNSNLNAYGLNVMQIIQSPRLNTAAYYLILGSGQQRNRIYNFYKQHGLSTTNLFS